MNLPVTCWYKEIYNKRAERYQYKFNHIEDNHVSRDKPLPMCKYQDQCWKKNKWKKVFTYLTGDYKVANEERIT